MHQPNQLACVCVHCLYLSICAVAVAFVYWSLLLSFPVFFTDKPKDGDLLSPTSPQGPGSHIVGPVRSLDDDEEIGKLLSVI